MAGNRGWLKPRNKRGGTTSHVPDRPLPDDQKAFQRRAPRASVSRTVCRPHQIILRLSAALVPGAMAAGVVDTLWTFEELFDRVVGGEYTISA